MTDGNPIVPAMLDHVVIRCRETEPMIAFYRDVIGCTMEREVMGLGLFQLRAGDSLIDLVDCEGELGRMGGAAPDQNGRNMDHFCLQVAPWDETAISAHLERHGVAIVSSGRRYGARGDGPSLYIEDPEGNTVELKGPPAE